MILSRSGAGFARGVTLLAVAVLVIFGCVATIAMLGSAEAFLVQAPALLATGARGHGAGSTSGRTSDALATLLVGPVTQWTGRSTSP